MLTHWIVAIEACRERVRSSSATVTIVVSKTTASAPMTTVKASRHTAGSTGAGPPDAEPGGAGEEGEGEGAGMTDHRL